MRRRETRSLTQGLSENGLFPVFRPAEGTLKTMDCCLRMSRRRSSRTTKIAFSLTTILDDGKLIPCRNKAVLSVGQSESFLVMMFGTLQRARCTGIGAYQLLETQKVPFREM